MMKIAILEWISGGGLGDLALSEIPLGLRDEGFAMFSCLARGFHQAGLHVVGTVDARLFSPLQLAALQRYAKLQALPRPSPATVSAAWRNIARDCQLSLVIAPEMQKTLQQITGMLRYRGVPLVNCTSDFLAHASDKMATAQLWQQHGIPHPPTRRWEEVDVAWLAAVRPPAADSGPGAGWVAKPADGAGSEGLQLYDRASLRAAMESVSQQPRGTTLLVQPWLPGVPLSCSAVVDHRGQAHWLPLVTQDFQPASGQRKTAGKASSPSIATATEAPATNWPAAAPQYVGCTLPPISTIPPAPVALLNEALHALGPGAAGWIGIDLLYDPQGEQWQLLELNPRCTTSLLGLAEAYSGNLVLEILRAFQGPFQGLSGSWQAVRYRLAPDR